MTHHSINTDRRDKLRNAEATLFIIAGFLVVLAILLTIAWHNSNTPPQNLEQREGRIEKIEHKYFSKMGRRVLVYIGDTGYALAYKESLSDTFPNLDALHVGDVITARVVPDTRWFIRNQGMPWEIKRGNETILAYDLMESFKIEKSRDTPQIAIVIVVIAGLFIAIGIGIRKYLSKSLPDLENGAPAPYADLSSSTTNLQPPTLVGDSLPSWLGPALQAYGVFAYIVVAWVMGLQFGAIDIALESSAGYLLARWWMRKVESRSTQPYPASIIIGFIIVHACLACLIDSRFAVWVIWVFLNLNP